ncbi:MAG: glycosyltransferase [Neomegalonema sp.]|nr:glycosyltransferase [Neomegalonema sp.]
MTLSQSSSPAPTLAAAPMTVFNYTVYRDNPYQPVMYSAIGDRYALEKGTIDNAMDGQRARKDGTHQLFHIHWEEHIIRRSPTEAEAMAAAKYFMDRLRFFRRRGGRVLWTIHNIAPHELEYEAVFSWLRSELLKSVDRICVHNLEAINVLREQGAVPLEKVVYLPHPAYHGFYEDAGDGAGALTGRELLVFGKVRRYKAIDKLLERFVSGLTAGQDIALRIAGEPLAKEGYGEQLLARFEGKPGLTLDFRRIPDEEVPQLFSQHAAAVLPYERFLTSGALLAAMTCGMPVIAPNVSQIREIVPAVNHAFLFDPAQPETLFDRAQALLALGAEERRSLRAEIRKRADYFHPDRISSQLGAVYDALSRA